MRTDHRGPTLNAGAAPWWSVRSHRSMAWECSAGGRSLSHLPSSAKNPQGVPGCEKVQARLRGPLHPPLSAQMLCTGPPVLNKYIDGAYVAEKEG